MKPRYRWLANEAVMVANRADRSSINCLRAAKLHVAQRVREQVALGARPKSDEWQDETAHMLCSLAREIRRVSKEWEELDKEPTGVG